MFADDLILFCEAETRSVEILMEAFQSFSTSIGLTVNYHKSEIVLRGFKGHIEQAILQITRFSSSSLPFRYIGIPIIAGRLSKIECRNMVENIIVRITKWTSRHFSYAGRAILIHSVLMGIYTFWAKLFVLP